MNGKTPEAKAWESMIYRCHKPSSASWARYGGRGIIVCDRWRESFWNFLEDMGERPSRQHTLDRIDNDGCYTPSNCRWATMKEQGRNRRTNRLVPYQGRMICLAEAEEITGIDRCTIRDRHQRGWKEPDLYNKNTSRQKPHVIKAKRK